MHSYGCHGYIKPGSKIRVTGGYDSMQIYGSVQLNATGHYYIDSESGMNCRYVQFTTPVSGIGTSSSPSSVPSVKQAVLSASPSAEQSDIIVTPNKSFVTG